MLSLLKCDVQRKKCNFTTANAFRRTSIRTSNASEPEWGWVSGEEMSRKGSEWGAKTRDGDNGE